MHRGRSPALCLACLQGRAADLCRPAGPQSRLSLRRTWRRQHQEDAGERRLLRLRREARRAKLRNGSSTTNFNLDNFSYARAPIPAGTEGGPLNPAEPLYASIPLLIEINRAPTGDYAGPPYCYGLFFDNVSQSFFNIGDDTYADMRGRYAFGALFGEARLLPVSRRRRSRHSEPVHEPDRAQFDAAQVRVRFHQGCYGYYDRASLERVARAYREARIPIDGLHIDIDFQDNYRVFTHSEMKFPRAAEMMAELHANGFKCSTT